MGDYLCIAAVFAACGILVKQQVDMITYHKKIQQRNRTAGERRW